jgi:hypothetical protein
VYRKGACTPQPRLLREKTDTCQGGTSSPASRSDQAVLHL